MGALFSAPPVPHPRAGHRPIWNHRSQIL